MDRCRGQDVQDILIVGGGIAGLSTALAVRRSFGAGIRIAVVDPEFGRRRPSSRVSALTAGSRRLLEAIGIWPTISGDAQPIVRMTITDSRRNDAVRPEFLHFDIPLRDGEAFAQMISNAGLTAALERDVAAEKIEVLTEPATRFTSDARRAHVRLASGKTLSTALVVGADGSSSMVRASLGHQTLGRDYGRSAIVATLSHEADHNGEAFQHFLPAGPFAMLPLTGRRSSIVWTEATEDAAAALALPDEDFVAEVTRRFGHRLGRLSLDDRPAAFPLRLRLSRRFVGARAALIGDAARVIHPLAGQGLNLAFADIGALIDSIAEPVRLGLDPGSAETLSDYQRARLFDSLAMAAATDGLHRLFSNDSNPLRIVRDIGLGLVERAPGLKRKLISEAAGLSRNTSTLLTGRLP